jgi:hypothetical protein
MDNHGVKTPILIKKLTIICLQSNQFASPTKEKGAGICAFFRFYFATR